MAAKSHQLGDASSWQPGQQQRLPTIDDIVLLHKSFPVHINYIAHTCLDYCGKVCIVGLQLELFSEFVNMALWNVIGLNTSPTPNRPAVDYSNKKILYIKVKFIGIRIDPQLYI